MPDSTRAELVRMGGSLLSVANHPNQYRRRCTEPVRELVREPLASGFACGAEGAYGSRCDSASLRRARLGRLPFEGEKNPVFASHLDPHNGREARSAEPAATRAEGAGASPGPTSGRQGAPASRTSTSSTSPDFGLRDRCPRLARSISRANASTSHGWAARSISKGGLR